MIQFEPQRRAFGNNRGLRTEKNMAYLREMMQKMQEDIKSLKNDKA
jgi:hypothetical protein